jgi:predicted RecB family nuclease
MINYSFGSKARIRLCISPEFAISGGNMAPKITLDDFQNLLHCKLKAYLKVKSQCGVGSDYEAMLKEVKRRVLRKAIEKISDTYGANNIKVGISINRNTLASGVAFVLDAELVNQHYAIHFDALRRVDGRSSLGNFHYIPVMFAEPRRVRQSQRLLLEVLALLLSSLQGKTPRMGVVYHGPECKTTTVRFPARLVRAEALRDEMAWLVASEAPPKRVLNKHCAVCEFRESCYGQAIQEDNLSLIRGIGDKEIIRYNRKGILTLTQLAHTFRPRRDTNQPNRLQNCRYHALHAMAIRDQKIYILGKPQISRSSVQMYLDMEGNPDEGFIYLIGVIICDGEHEERYSFWADNATQEQKIFDELFLLIARFQDPVIYVYGSYERVALKRARNHTDHTDCADKVLDALVNVLSIIYAHFYLPTYSNSLKEVGRLFGMTWRHGVSSGIESIVARARWESTHEEKWKSALIEYNFDDCVALQRVTEFLRTACSEAPIAPVSALDSPTKTAMPAVTVVKADDYPAYSPRLGRPNFAHPDFEFVNARAYFNYQQLRVFVRTSKLLKKHLSHMTKNQNSRLRLSQKVQIRPSDCPKCGGDDLLAVQRPNRSDGVRPRRRRVFDLMITPSGAKRRVIECSTSVYECLGCTHRFVPDGYYRVAKHSHGLMSWAMYQHIAHQLSLRTLEELFGEFFGLRINKSEIHLFKELLACYYQDTYRQFTEGILAGPVLHVDETEVKLKVGKGYVWVFATFDKVVYLYRRTREGAFLQDFLKEFKGVLVTDFYAAYESLDCPQQKCLIHLLRDMNQALLDHPFDSELQSIVRPFGSLLRSIVATVDEHGLQRRHLAKYIRRVRKFFRDIVSQRYHSDAAISLQQRLIKNRTRLFTFLSYDAVPWNNNVAENAIKQFAYYREGAVGVMSEEGIQNYLVLLSIYQTCRYQGISFLKFLMSKERDIERFCTTKRSAQHKPSVELYPLGFSLGDHARPELVIPTITRSDRGVSA